MKIEILSLKELGELVDFKDLLVKRILEGLSKDNLGRWHWTYLDYGASSLPYVDGNGDSYGYTELCKSLEISELVMKITEFYKSQFHPNERAMWHNDNKRFFILNSIVVDLAKAWKEREGEQ